ncbi:MAG: hypothetical protein H7138_27855, partial [Myxococcales bacterium]|nr:hypothetical protein [Myxococcales bacterium]
MSDSSASSSSSGGSSDGSAPAAFDLGVRRATLDDLAVILPRTAELNRHEAIKLEPAALEASLAQLLGDPGVGGVWLVERGGVAIGYAIVTFGYDLEFGGRDA